MSLKHWTSSEISWILKNHYWEQYTLWIFLISRICITSKYSYMNTLFRSILFDKINAFRFANFNVEDMQAIKQIAISNKSCYANDTWRREKSKRPCYSPIKIEIDKEFPKSVYITRKRIRLRLCKSRSKTCCEFNFLGMEVMLSQNKRLQRNVCRCTSFKY